MNRLDVERYPYNGLATRGRNDESPGTATYSRDGLGVTDPVLNDGTAAYTPGNSQRRSGVTTYDLNDRLGTASRQTDTSATTTATRTYDAFGMLLASTGTPKGPFGFAGAHGYPEDSDSGLDLLGHRYYDASTGRFLNRDPAQDGRNWYVYCKNGPETSVDALGTEWHYIQKTGYLYRISDEGNVTIIPDPGFSGRKGKWRNNPDYEDEPKMGPLPRGGYKISNPFIRHRKHHKPLPCMRLSPDKDNEMYGRDGFLIHGGSRKGDPSQGCIIFPKPVRKIISKSGDHHLTVE